MVGWPDCGREAGVWLDGRGVKEGSMARSLHLLMALLATGLGACSASQTAEPVAASEPPPPPVEAVQEPSPLVSTPAAPPAAVVTEQPTYALGDHYTKTEHQIP